LPSAQELTAFIDDLIALRPDHPGGYDLRAEYHYNVTRDYRAALADYRKAKALMRPEYPRRVLVAHQLNLLEPMARWDGKLPAVLRGEVRPATATEFADLAAYCAKFETKYALAARFAGEALAADPALYANWGETVQFAEWAVQAGLGMGNDATDLSPEERAKLRQQALAWLRELTQRYSGEVLEYLVLSRSSALRPLRNQNELAKLPPAERDEWNKFWEQIRPTVPKPGAREVAPPPRPVKM
jgi:hypothetical protein